MLDKIKKLEGENKQLKEENKKLASEALAEEVTELKQQLEKLNKQQTTQIETPAKNNNKIKHFFQFGVKK